jgi:hypothetical protein
MEDLLYDNWNIPNKMTPETGILECTLNAYQDQSAGTRDTSDKRS